MWPSPYEPTPPPSISSAIPNTPQTNNEPTQKIPHPYQPHPTTQQATEAACPQFTTGTHAAAGSVRSEPWRRSTHPLRAQRESPPLPEPPQRTQDRSRGAPTVHPAVKTQRACPHSTTQRRPKEPVPNSSPAPCGSGTRPEQALEAITPSPRAQRESSPSSELPCARRHGPAEPPPCSQPSKPSKPVPQSRIGNDEMAPFV